MAQVYITELPLIFIRGIFCFRFLLTISNVFTMSLSPNSLPFGMTSMTITKSGLEVIANTVSVLYDHPSRPYLFVFRFKYNEDVPNCLENHILRDPQLSTWKSKCELLTKFLDRNLAKLPEVWHSVTGIKLWTKPCGQLEVKIAEDLSHTLFRISGQEFPSRKFTSSSAITLPSTPLSRHCPEIYAATFQGQKYLYKAHESAFLNDIFRTDVRAYYRYHINTFPHILKAVDMVINENNYVEGMLLEWCKNGSLSDLLGKGKVTSKQKIRWISQVAHALISLHHSHIPHGCVLAHNVFIDEDDDAKLTGFMLETGYDSANPESKTKGTWSEFRDWDIVNLGRLMWQCLNDNPDKIVALESFKEDKIHDVCGIGIPFISLMQGCFSDTRSEILLKIAGLGRCGRDILKKEAD